MGGGIRTLDDCYTILHAGADKVSINTAAFERPALLEEAARQFGSQCIVCAIDARRTVDPAAPYQFEVYLHGGRTATGVDAIAWARAAESRGAGEILLTSMDRDGSKAGYDLELLRAVRSAVSTPVIASGGAGLPEHLVQAIVAGHADAALAASIFHFREYNVDQVKDQLAAHGLPVRRRENAVPG